MLWGKHRIYGRGKINQRRDTVLSRWEGHGHMEELPCSWSRTCVAGWRSQVGCGGVWRDSRQNRMAPGRDETLWSLGGEHRALLWDSVCMKFGEGTLLSESAVLRKGLRAEFWKWGPIVGFWEGRGKSTEPHFKKFLVNLLSFHGSRTQSWIHGFGHVWANVQNRLPKRDMLGQWVTPPVQTLLLPRLILDLHCPQSVVPVIFLISLSSCMEQELWVITDFIFVSCLTFRPSGSPMVSAFGLYPGSPLWLFLYSKPPLSLTSCVSGLSAPTPVLSFCS